MNYLQRKKLAFMSIVNSVKGFVRTVSGIPPLTVPDCVDTESVINYTISGNGVGDYDESTGKYKIPVVCGGKNMFDKYNYTIAPGYYNDNGEHKPSADNSTWYIENYYPVYSGTYYRISGIKGRKGEPSAVYFYDKDKQWISRVRYSYAEVMSSGFTFKTPIECKFVRFQIHGNDPITENIFNKDIFMFELGTVTTDYEPYVEPVTTNIYLDESLAEGQTIEYKADNLPKLPTIKGTTIYSIDTQIQPSNMEVTYYSTSKE